jgi:hypothetical protein
MHWNRGVCRVFKSLRDFCDGSVSPVNHTLCSVPFAAICIHITRHLCSLTGQLQTGVRQSCQTPREERSYVAVIGASGRQHLPGDDDSAVIKEANILIRI